MERYAGDFLADETVYIHFTTNDAAGGAVAPSSVFEAADIVIYKNGSDTERTSAVGLTMTSPVDARVSHHRLAVDTSNDTDVGFYATGNDYTILLAPDETVDGQTVVSVIGTFSIQNRYMRGTDAAATAAQIGTAGAALTDLGGMSTGMKAEVNAEVDTANTDYNAVVPADLPTNFGDLGIEATTGKIVGVKTTDLNTTTTSNTDMLTSANIADAVWDEARSGHVAAGSTGEAQQLIIDIDTEVDTIDTNVNLIVAKLPTGNISDFDNSTETVDLGAVNGNAAAASNLQKSASAIVQGTAITGTLSTTQMTTDLTEATNDHYKGRIIIWTSGALLNQATDITAYAGASKLFTFTATTEAPSNTDTFIIV